MKSQVGDRIRKLRKARNLTQEEFAGILGVHRAHISRIEVGTANPSIVLLKGICQEFKVREAWLVNGESSLTGVTGFSKKQIENIELRVDTESEGALLATIDDTLFQVIKMIYTLPSGQGIGYQANKPSQQLLKKLGSLIGILMHLISQLQEAHSTLTKQRENQRKEEIESGDKEK